MGPLSAILIAIAGISFIICLEQLIILLRRRFLYVFVFGASLSIIFFFYILVTVLSMIRQDNPMDLLADLRIRMIFIQLVLFSFIGVTYHQLKEIKKIIMIVVAMVMLIIAGIGLGLPDQVLFGEKPGLYLIVLTTGDRILMIAPRLTTWRLLIDISCLVYLISVILILTRNQYKYKFIQTLPIVAGALLVFVFALFDQMVDFGSVNSYYILPFGLFVNYLILSYMPFYHLMEEVFRQHEVIDREKRWSTLIDEANVIVVALNRMGHVDYINPFFFRLTGYKEDEVVGKDWFEFFVPSDEYYEVQSAFIEILEFDFHPRFQNSILTKFNEQRLIDWYNVRLRDEKEQVTGSISIGVDVTDETNDMDNIKKRLIEAESLINILKKDNKS